MQCPRCQHENLAGAKFCNGCGARLGASADPLAASRLRAPDAYTPRHLAERILTSGAALEGERKQLYRRTGTCEQAHEHLTAATAMYREMDMAHWLEQANAETKKGAS